MKRLNDADYFDENIFLKDYYGRYQRLLFNDGVHRDLLAMREMLLDCKKRGGAVFFGGNGASASIAGHCALDFTKQAGVRAHSFSDPALITALANDYGYEHWLTRAFRFYAAVDDVAVLISSSGKSANVVNAAKYLKNRNIPLITLTGFAEDNPLKQLGDLNLWVDSKAYNIIECTHMVWLTSVIDLVIGKAEYAVN